LGREYPKIIVTVFYFSRGTSTLTLYPLKIPDAAGRFVLDRLLTIIRYYPQFSLLKFSSFEEAEVEDVRTNNVKRV